LNTGAKVIKTILNNFYFHLAKKKLFVYLRPDFAGLFAWLFLADKTIRHEKNISTLQEEKKEQTWFQRAHGNRQREESAGWQKGQRKKEINRIL